MNDKNEVMFDTDLLMYVKCGRPSDSEAASLNKELIRACNHFGSLLHYAVLYGNTSMVKHLINLGSQVDFLGRNDNTPLMLAVEVDKSAVVNVLLKAKANIDILNAEGESALHMALNGRKKCDSVIVKAFIRKAKVRCRTTEALAKRLIAAGCNMQSAAFFGDIKVLKYMLENGIELNPASSDRGTALHTAAAMNDLSMVKWLIYNGADVNAADRNGYTPLLECVLRNKKDIMKILLEHGADPNCSDKYRHDTPLFSLFVFADRNENLSEYVELLLQHGAIPQNPDRASTFRGAIFDYAFDCESDEIVKMLIGQLAMLEMLGMSDPKSVMYCEFERNQLKLSELNTFYQLCQEILKLNMFDKLSLVDLLNAKEHIMRLLVRKETFVSQVKKISFKNQLNELHSYYYNTLLKRIEKANRAVELEDKAIPIICKIFDGHYNQCYNFARQVVSYLNEHDLERLVQVY